MSNFCHRSPLVDYYGVGLHFMNLESINVKLGHYQLSTNYPSKVRQYRFRFRNQSAGNRKEDVLILIKKYLVLSLR
jgi:hypothetical protein